MASSRGRTTQGSCAGVRIVGATAAGAPALERSWRAGRVVPYTEWDTIADGAATREPVPELVDRMRTLVDDVVLVDDEAMLRAMALAEDTLGLLLEPAGAIGIAAIATFDVPGNTVATVLTGANRDPHSPGRRPGHIGRCRTDAASRPISGPRLSGRMSSITRAR
jgi:threonine dehydratase